MGAIFSRLRDAIGFFLYLKAMARTRTGIVNNFELSLFPGDMLWFDRGGSSKQSSARDWR
jgi:hypothetical protein